MHELLKDGTKIKIDVPYKIDAVKKACLFLFSTEGKYCEFVDQNEDILVDGYPTRQSLCGLTDHINLEDVNMYYYTYENDFLSVVTTDNYEYPRGYDTIWIPATLQKIESAVNADFQNIKIYDINNHTLKFCSSVISGQLENAISMIKFFGKRTSPISLSLEDKIEITIKTSNGLKNTDKNISFFNFDIITANLQILDLIDVSNIFVFPRNTWYYTQEQLEKQFEKFDNAIGWTPNFQFIRPEYV